MNPSLIQAATEISRRSGVPFTEVLENLKHVWTPLTGQKVQTAVPVSEMSPIDDVSIDEFDL